MRKNLWKLNNLETARGMSPNDASEIKNRFFWDTGRGVTVIYPIGIPAFGITFHGVFMASPLILFCLILGLFPVVGFVKGWVINGTSILLTSGSLVLIYGLIKTFLLMAQNRDLFPHRHFVTMGVEGIAGHFARWQIPEPMGRSAIPWNRVKSVQRGRCIFLPAFIRGSIYVDAILVQSMDGDILAVPVCVPDRESEILLLEIEETIVARRRSAGV